MSIFRPICLLMCLILGFSTVSLWAQDKSDTADEQAKSAQVKDNYNAPWVKRDDGMMYQVLHEGKGERIVKKDDHVTLAYAAFVKGAQKPFSMTANGKVINFQVGNANIMEGIQRGILGMKVAEKRRIVIPPELGLGDQQNKDVPPGSTLVVVVIVTQIHPPVTWKQLKKGTGVRRATSGDIVSVNYVGKLEDGTIFDSNDSTTAPLRLGVGTTRVINGFSTGVMGMSVGEKRRIVIPPYWGYGDKPRAGIPANSTLTFDVTCLSVEDGYSVRVLKRGTGPVIEDGQTGKFALRVELLTGQVLLDNQFGKLTNVIMSPNINPSGIYYMARGMHVGDVRQAVLKPEFGYAQGSAYFGKPLNITLDLTAIEGVTK